MLKINMNSVKEKYDTGVDTLKNAYNTAKDLTVHPKLSASLTVKSNSSDERYFDKGIKVDKEVSLLQIICWAAAVLCALAAATVVVNEIFNFFGCKKHCSEKSKKCISEESKEQQAD